MLGTSDNLADTWNNKQNEKQCLTQCLLFFALLNLVYFSLLWSRSSIYVPSLYWFSSVSCAYEVSFCVSQMTSGRLISSCPWVSPVVSPARASLTPSVCLSCVCYSLPVSSLSVLTLGICLCSRCVSCLRPSSSHVLCVHFCFPCFVTSVCSSCVPLLFPLSSSPVCVFFGPFPFVPFPSVSQLLVPPCILLHSVPVIWKLKFPSYSTLRFVSGHWATWMACLWLRSGLHSCRFNSLIICRTVGEQ